MTTGTLCHMDWIATPLGSDRPYLDGEREGTLIVQEKFTYMNNGIAYCYWFSDSACHRIVWFTKRKYDLTVGETVRARFTIKSHRVYRGVVENIVKGFSYSKVSVEAR